MKIADGVGGIMKAGRCENCRNRARGSALVLGVVVQLMVQSLVAYTSLAATPPVCSYQGVYAFGDSLTDVGNGIASFPNQFIRSESVPYGLQFPHHAADRFCDGRLLVDFLGKRNGVNLSFPFQSGCPLLYAPPASILILRLPTIWSLPLAADSWQPSGWDWARSTPTSEDLQQISQTESILQPLGPQHAASPHGMPQPSSTALSPSVRSSSGCNATEFVWNFTTLKLVSTANF